MIEVPVRVERAFRLPAPPAAAWAWLRDVPRWGALFPGVATVEPYGERGGADAPSPPGGADQDAAGPDSLGAFLWTMDPMGPPGGRVTTTYACRYRADDATHALDWTPIDGVGNARFAGDVQIRPAPGGAAGTLRLEAALQIPAPGFARPIVEPAVAFEMGRMTDGFLDRLGRALNS